MSHVKVQQQQLEAEFDAATELLLCAREQLSVKKWPAMECAVSAAFFLQKASGTLEFACLSRSFTSPTRSNKILHNTCRKSRLLFLISTFFVPLFHVLLPQDHRIRWGHASRSRHQPLLCRGNLENRWQIGLTAFFCQLAVHSMAAFTSVANHPTNGFINATVTCQW